MRIAIALCLALASFACGPQLGGLEKGERGRVVAAYNGDTLELDTGLRAFLAEVDAPRGEAAYAAQAQGELEALALHREVRLAYGGERRWVARPREGQTEAPPEAAIAHVFVKSEGGRWFWLQHEMVSRGAAFVRPRGGNHARSAALAEVEARARAGDAGLWAERSYRVLNAGQAADAAIAFGDSCLRGLAPYRLVEGRIGAAQIFDTRAALPLEAAGEAPFALVVFGDSFEAWSEPPLASLNGARVRVRGALGTYRGEPQLCLEHASQLEVLRQ